MLAIMAEARKFSRVTQTHDEDEDEEVVFSCKGPKSSRARIPLNYDEEGDDEGGSEEEDGIEEVEGNEEEDGSEEAESEEELLGCDDMEVDEQVRICLIQLLIIANVVCLML